MASLWPAISVSHTHSDVSSGEACPSFPQKDSRERHTHTHPFELRAPEDRAGSALDSEWSLSLPRDTASFPGPQRNSPSVGTVRSRHTPQTHLAIGACLLEHSVERKKRRSQG